MQFLRENTGAAERTIAKQICDALYADTRVLWLVSGGSNVASEVAIMEQVRNHCIGKLEGLAILPMDERYGSPGHENSNVQALRAAGFDAGEATLIDVLMHNMPFEQTLAFYSEVTGAALDNAGAIIGQFGLGADGHVAGVLPGSVATEANENITAGYEWTDYLRLTLTPHALRAVQVAYVLAYGSSKQAALDRLRQKAEPLRDLPAMLLYDIADVYVYNDQLKQKGVTT
jgi:6-phosphogluconolactonase/glucosamine-6-phosphate isomerase/deaminase